MDLSVIIVSFNTKTLTLECLRAIYRETSHLQLEVILVDNHSSDGTVAAVKQEFSKVVVSDAQRNLGFAVASNLGLAQARGRYALLLNPDTVILDRGLEVMVSFMDANRDVGIVGGKMYDGDRRPWRYQTWRPSAVRYLLSPFLVRLFGDIGNKDVDWVCGACLMIRSDVMRAIGALDTFVFGEDFDLCWRAKHAGWRVFHLADARLIHYFGASAAKPEIAAWRVFVTRQAKLYYMLKHFGRKAMLCFGLALVLEAMAKIPFLLFAWTYSSPSDRLRRWNKVKGYVSLLGAMCSGAVLRART